MPLSSGLKMKTVCYWLLLLGGVEQSVPSTVAIFITIKNPLPWLGLNPRPLGSVASTLTTSLPK
jgi:hypothetical protein